MHLNGTFPKNGNLASRLLLLLVTIVVRDVVGNRFPRKSCVRNISAKVAITLFPASARREGGRGKRDS